MLLNAQGKPVKPATSAEGAQMFCAILLSGQTIFLLADGDKWFFPAALVRDRSGAPAFQPLLESFLRSEFMPRVPSDKLLHLSSQIKPAYAKLYHAFVTQQANQSGALVAPTPEARDAIVSERL